MSTEDNDKLKEKAKEFGKPVYDKESKDILELTYVLKLTKLIQEEKFIKIETLK